ncbi:MAG: GTP cyclohydrolase I FolE [Acidobacteria bacterium]|nr:GTP cyclohydrolase I FolE [Acidobacteriota bacterium]
MARDVKPLRPKARRDLQEAASASNQEVRYPKLEALVEEVLRQMGEDPTRDGLLDTPRRVAEALRYLTSGYGKNPADVLNRALYTVAYDEMVLIKDIDMFSLCEHHILPFFGKCHVAYIPNKKVIGLSKIARLVEMYSRRLQLQERLTCQIAETINDTINPQGVGVVIEAQHLCMIMRGVEKQNSVAVTSSMLGVFRDELRTREEFLELIKRPH